MSFQETATAIAPWLAITTAVVGFLAGGARLVGMRRVRDNLQRDAEILQALPPGPAKSLLEETVERQAEVLRDRVVHGVRPKGLQYWAIVAGYNLVGGLLARLGMHVENRWPTEPDFVHEIFYWSWKICAIWALVVGLVLAVVVALTAAMEWLERQRSHADDSDPIQLFGRFVRALKTAKPNATKSAKTGVSTDSH